jgi:IclR family acetate operon transcriptional repressor
LFVAESDEVNAPSGKRGVQSIARAFGLLENIADAGGTVGISELSKTSGLPLPTIHRLVRTLVALGYARQEPSREYTLGPRLVRLGDSASRLLESWANPHLRRLAERLGESANFALIDGAEVVYVAQASGRQHSMRMFTDVGHRASVHCTAVGKAILATYERDAALAVLNRANVAAYTVHTITTVDGLMAELETVRAQGFATDMAEQEIGVCCVAVALPGSPARGAVSISGPSTRMTADVITRSVPLLTSAAGKLANELDQIGR